MYEIFDESKEEKKEIIDRAKVCGFVRTKNRGIFFFFVDLEDLYSIDSSNVDKSIEYWNELFDRFVNRDLRRDFFLF